MKLFLAGLAFFALLMFSAWKGSAPAFIRIKRFLSRVTSSPVTAAIALVIVAMTAYALPSLLWRVPTPVVHDEFAYLLQGDTFAHGRLTNPPHALSEFFETFHVLQSPTYSSKFPPGLGIMLAIGYRIGLPIAGMWISAALGCAAVFWMLRAVLPTRWAALVSLLTVFHPTVIWFSQTYWGGGVAMTGGALLGGAVVRAIGNPTATLGLIAGAGISILAISRPFEGLLVSVACGVALLLVALRDGQIRGTLLRFAPAAMVLPLITICWILYYNYRITGHPLQMPYALHTERYMSAPLFYWQSVPHQPEYPNETMRKFHTQIEWTEYSGQLGWQNFLISVADRFGMVSWAYLRSIVMALPLLVALAYVRNRIVIISLVICVAALALHVSICPWMRVAYFAPLMGMLMIPIGLGLRSLYVWRKDGQPIGRALVRAIVLTQLAAGAYQFFSGARDNARTTIAQRQEVLQSLHKQGGRHLVLVRHTPDHSPAADWVYNAADIDGSPVIFARDLGQADSRILERYADRTTWLLEVDRRTSKLTPLSDSATQPPVANSALEH